MVLPDMQMRTPASLPSSLRIARDRVTLSSYSDDGIRERVEKWADGVPALA